MKNKISQKSRILNNYLPVSKEQSSSQEADSFSASQGIPRILRNPSSEEPATVPILSQINPLQAPTLFFKGLI